MPFVVQEPSRSNGVKGVINTINNVGLLKKAPTPSDIATGVIGSKAGSELSDESITQNNENSNTTKSSIKEDGIPSSYAIRSMAIDSSGEEDPSSGDRELSPVSRRTVLSPDVSCRE